MRKMRLMLLSVLFALGAAPALAQLPTPTAEQLELFKSMSPQDREAIMEQLGLDPSALGDLGNLGSGTNSRRSANRDTDNLRDPRLLGDEERKRLDKVIRAEDSILIDIDFKKD